MISCDNEEIWSGVIDTTNDITAREDRPPALISSNKLAITHDG
jgi:hypothetical protein